MNTIPTKLEEIEVGVKYQIMYPMSNIWSEVKIFDNNICRSKKENLRRLIEDKRLRILK